MINAIGRLLAAAAKSVRALFQTQAELALENLALRQQVSVLKRERPRPTLSPLDMIFWVGLRRLWDGWVDALIVVQPETVVRWHRRGFKLYWAAISKPKAGGRPRKDREIAELVRRLVRENSPCPFGERT